MRNDYICKGCNIDVEIGCPASEVDSQFCKCCGEKMKRVFPPRGLAFAQSRIRNWAHFRKEDVIGESPEEQRAYYEGSSPKT